MLSNKTCRVMKRIFLFAIACVLFMGCSSKITVDNSVTPDFDINRYLGNWYEIARFDHPFERGIDYAKANYSLREDGKITVTNTGIKNDLPKTALGKAKLTDTPALLRVSFFGPFYSDYRVLMVSEDYRYALVGSNSDNYLWILSRTRILPDKDVYDILTEAINRGYKVENFIWVDQ